MSIGTMIFIGLLVAFVANKFVMRRGEGLLRDFGLGTAGAVLTAGTLRMVSLPSETGFSTSAAVVAIVGASAVIYLFHTFYPHVSPR
jgi:uncharacterized membrane protein YeaQ/YmgE (transglycosylase-associated protein family)